MRNPKLLILILVILLQLAVPAKMIIEHENILTHGKVFRFKTAPVDPYNPFMGKYITLRYEEEAFQLHKNVDWLRNETIFVILSTDSAGFAKIIDVNKTRPSMDVDFIEAKVSYMSGDSIQKVYIDYPFTRFYMEESKASGAEGAYQKSSRDTTQITYALVTIKHGKTAVKDVMIDGVSIKKIVQTENK